MHIKISKSSLSEALNNVQAVVGSKNALQVLQNVMVEATDKEVKFTCSDLDVTLVANAECEVLDAGATTIPVKPFASAVGKMVDGTIEITVDESDCSTISGGSSVFKFKGLSAKEFPSIPKPDGATCEIASNSIREMLRKTAFATSQDDTRRTLQGVLLDFQKDKGIVKAVGTDGRRLAMLDCSLENSNGFAGQYIRQEAPEGRQCGTRYGEGAVARQDSPSHSHYETAGRHVPKLHAGASEDGRQ